MRTKLFRSFEKNIGRFLLLSIIIVVGAFASSGYSADSQYVAGVDTSKWHGFNLLEKFTASRNSPFLEADFKWISEFGFNFVRLPLDYRCYVEQDDWLKFKESALKDIDQAIEYGKKYNIHVCINLHRAPGYCINPPKEKLNLWTDETAQKTFIEHWQMFARRYKGIPSKIVSFNLVNEPAGTTYENYLKVCEKTIQAIHQEDPDRLVIVDGFNVGSVPMKELLPVKNVARATGGYHPATISHYKASWMSGSDKWPEPTWPDFKPNGYLFGPVKNEYKSPLVLKGDFKSGTEISLKFSKISGKITLKTTADGKAVAENVVDPENQTQNWQIDGSEKRYRLHNAVGDAKFNFKLNSDAKEVAIENVAGDWIIFDEIQITMPGLKPVIIRTSPLWGQPQTVCQISPEGKLLPPPGFKSNAKLMEYLKPWVEIAKNGETVFVGEWGCFNRTPHDVALAWMKDWLELWKENRFGWALWNFRGGFGILDSGRTDVQYEDWNGHKLDRKMLQLLQQYSKN